MLRENVQITRGNRTGVIRSAVQMQSRYYSQNPGFNEDYEINLAKKLAELEPRIGHQGTEVWTAIFQDEIVGAIFVDGADDGQSQARLTSFIVGDGYRGVGIGRQLLTEAINFIDEQGFKETQLWTFEGSDAARRLYESVGFVIEKQFEGEFFGKQLTVQLFVRTRRGIVSS